MSLMLVRAVNVLVHLTITLRRYDCSLVAEGMRCKWRLLRRTCLLAGCIQRMGFKSRLLSWPVRKVLLIWIFMLCISCGWCKLCFMEYEQPLSWASSSVSYPGVGCGCAPTLYLLKYSVHTVYVCKLGHSENLYGIKKNGKYILQIFSAEPVHSKCIY
jgi:hypothetical protein